MTLSSPLRRRSIRTHIVLMVLVGAIIPLALIGLWATASAVRSGKQLLHDQLAAAARTLAQGIDEKWRFRRGELLLLAENSAARKALAGATLSREDSQYLAGLYRQVAHVIPSFSYRDTGGRVRWSTAGLPTPGPSNGIADGAAAGAAPQRAPGPAFGVSLPGHDSTGATVGWLDARVALDGLVSTDSGRLSVPGAVLGVRDRATSAVLASSSRAPSLSDTGEVTIAGTRWMAVWRSVDEPALTLGVAAPTEPYVAPFAEAGRVSFAAVVLVAIVALALSAYLTARLTSPLERLVEASSAVARGDLARRVDAEGPSEIETLGASFNTMTESLRRTMAELSRRSALAAVGEFAASLAHEVRNALTSVKVDLQRAEEKLEPGTTSRELVSRSLFAVTHLDSAVTGALRVARSGNVSPQLLDLRPVLAGATERATPAFAQGGGALDREALEGPPLWVNGDAGSLEQLFLNLLLNAAQALEGRGDGRASVRACEENGHVIVSIADSGPGIDPEHLPRVTEPFFTTRAGGTGLGLPIARQIAIAHGGELSVDSDRGPGTVVRVRLPRAESA